jgi:hypothetical protein
MKTRKRNDLRLIYRFFRLCQAVPPHSERELQVFQSEAASAADVFLDGSFSFAVRIVTGIRTEKRWKMRKKNTLFYPNGLAFP